jgi:fatty acid amide hydrolase 2
MMADGKFYNPILSLLAWSVRQSDHTLPAIALSAIEPLSKLIPGRTKAMVEKGRALRQELTEIIGQDGVMLYPSYSHAAPPHLKPLAMTFNWVYTAILNVMELPVTQVPLGLNQEGLPLGVQVAGVHGNDSLTIAVALELEKAFGGWTPPPLLKTYGTHAKRLDGMAA